MTKIGNPDGQQSQWRAGYPSDDDYGQHRRPNIETQSSDWHSLDSTASSRDISAFQKSFHKALRSFGDDDGTDSDSESSDRFAQASLLAIATQGLQTGLPSPATAAASSAALPSPDIERAVTAMTNCILQNIRADASSAGQSFEVNLVFAGDMASALGVTRISVSGTATDLDIVLERVAADSSDQLRQAAQLLAERLRTRFDKRTVRVLDRAAPGHPNSGEALTLESWLDPGGF